MKLAQTVLLLLSAFMIIVCFHLHSSRAEAEVQAVTPCKVSVEVTVEHSRTVTENVTEPTPSHDRRFKRKAVHRIKTWPDGIIPYKFDLSTDSKVRQDFKRAMRMWERYTCLRFRTKRHKDNIWVDIRIGQCVAMIGRTMPGQVLQIGRHCYTFGSILHEIGHTIGLYHEHSRWDRDNYIKVNMHNIVQNMDRNFAKSSREKSFTYGIPYDYYSIMHYGRKEFSKNGEDTIVPHDASVKNIIGNTNNPSFNDYKIVNKLYRCGEKCQKKRCPDEGFLTKDCICYCKTSTYRDPMRKCSEPECQDLYNKCREKARNNGCQRDYAYMSRNCKKTCRKCPGDRHHKKKPECRDLYYKCREKARNNGCQRDYAFMSRYCKKTCRKCPGEIHHMKQPECRDIYHKCREKAKNNGCQRHYAFMSWNCKKTCRRCPGEIHYMKKPECRDIYHKCREKAKNNGCQRHYVFMSWNCKKTCRRCPGKIHYMKKPECRDIYHNCWQKAKNNGCQRDYAFMSRQCKKTCRQCPGDRHHKKKTGCRDLDKRCREKARNNGCVRNRYYMSRNCKKTCRKCPVGIYQGNNPKCRDNTVNCREWAKNNGCQVRYAHMKVHCSRTCGICS